MSHLKSNNKLDLIPSLMSDFFDRTSFFNHPAFESTFGASVPAVNVKEDERQFEIELAAPGFSKNEFKVDVDNNVLTVSAEKNEEKNDSNQRFTRREFTYNRFSRAFTLPPSVNADKIEAHYGQGVLQVLIPKKQVTPSAPKKQIQIH